MSDDPNDSTEEEEVVEEETVTEEEPAKKSRGRKKTSRGRSGSKGRRVSPAATAAPRLSLEERIRCGGCNNLMTQSNKNNWTEIKGKKVPKGDDGEYLYSSPEMPEGKVGTVLCSDCKLRSENPNSGFRIHSAIIERRGELTNVPITDIPDRGE